MLVGSIMIVGVLSRCVLFHNVCNLKVTQINGQQSNLGIYALQV